MLKRAEIRGELVKIVLAPFFIRMMMAFGAFHADAEKKLAEHGGQFGRFAAVAINNDWPFTMIASFGGDDFAGELIVRFVFAE